MAPLAKRVNELPICFVTRHTHKEPSLVNSVIHKLTALVSKVVVWTDGTYICSTFTARFCSSDIWETNVTNTLIKGWMFFSMNVSFLKSRSTLPQIHTLSISQDTTDGTVPTLSSSIVFERNAPYWCRLTLNIKTNNIKTLCIMFVG